MSYSIDAFTNDNYCLISFIHYQHLIILDNILGNILFLYIKLPVLKLRLYLMLMQTTRKVGNSYLPTLHYFDNIY